MKGVKNMSNFHFCHKVCLLQIASHYASASGIGLKTLDEDSSTLLHL